MIMKHFSKAVLIGIVSIFLSSHVFGSLIVNSPNGGEVWEALSVHNITWETPWTSISNVKIEYSIDNGSIWTTIISSTPDDGSYPWTVPNTPSTTCKVRIKDADDGNPVDVSDSSFSIIPLPDLNLVAPNGGEIWAVGSSYKITWTSIGNVGNVKIESSTDSGSSWTNIVSSTENDGEYSWIIPNTPSTTCKIKVSEASDGSPTDMSDSIFSIATTPTVETKAITLITTNSAVSGGNFTSDGCAAVTSRGVCWSTSSNPTIANAKTTDGSGITSFTSTLTGLSSNTVYFVRAYATNSQGTSYGNERSFATPIAPYVLDIKSTPEIGVLITLSPNDNSSKGDGETNFKRKYNSGAEVTLTAPPSYHEKNFITWKVDNVDQAGQTIKVTMNHDHTAQAVYQYSTCTLTVQSSPDSGIPITVSPDDNNNIGSGNTVFIRTYNSGTIVTLTAPPTYNGKNFLRWLIDGLGNSNQTINVTMDTNHTVQAVYQSDTYTLTIQSTPYTGVGITVTPLDKNGNGNGYTSFTRTYEQGKLVTLTAPSLFSGNNFIKWSVDGKEYTNQTIQVTIDANHNAVVYYETSNPAEIAVNRKSLNFCYIKGSSNMPRETFTIYNRGGGTLNWSASTEIEGVGMNPTSGTNCGVVEVTVNPVGLIPATYEGVIYVTDPLVSNSPVEVKLNLCVKQEASPPFGDFSTPLDDSIVYNSFPVTGWALGNTGIDSVKIYREHGSNLVYIGDAIFVEGARPDVEDVYPNYPMNYKAGWGYMMLTHFLPNGGNGTFKIHAIATDKERLTADLGTKTITVVNSLAAKPFGAIDFPAPGGTASGDNYRNHGWVLTPPPNKIPENGSTINIYVDGIYLGHPVYNLYRPDIAALFPGYVNVKGAGAYFDFDTTTYENGIHTIYWTATDNAGNSDGIGSRYFTIQNTGASAGCISQSSVSITTPLDIDFSAIPVDYSEPVKSLSGFTESPDTPDAPEMYPGENGIIEIEIKELERVEIHLTQSRADVPLLNCKGYLVVNDQLRPLPIGSTLDYQRGIFYWQPGLGFVGKYHFIFIEKKPNGELSRRNISVEILPKHSL